MLKRTLDYFGFELESELETVEDFPPDLAEARRLLAEALARGEARHLAVKKNHDVIERIREAYKKSGGTTPGWDFRSSPLCTRSSWPGSTRWTISDRRD